MAMIAISTGAKTRCVTATDDASSIRFSCRYSAIRNRPKACFSSWHRQVHFAGGSEKPNPYGPPLRTSQTEKQPGEVYNRPPPVSISDCRRSCVFGNSLVLTRSDALNLRQTVSFQ